MTPSQHRTGLCVLQLVQPRLSYGDALLFGHVLHPAHGITAFATGLGDPAAAAEWTQLTSTNNINAFVKITEHLYSIFARNINKKGWS